MEIRPKDLILDLYGDYIRNLDGKFRPTPLANLLEIFEVEPTNVRMTLSRMKKDGWFETQKVGREAEYTATPKLINLLDEGLERIFTPATPIWDGRWLVTVFRCPQDKKAEEAAFKRMKFSGAAQLSPTTWLFVPQSGQEISTGNTTAMGLECTRFISQTQSTERDRELVTTYWHLDDLAQLYTSFINEWSGLLHDHSSLSPDQSLYIRVKLIYTFRQFLFQDPNLPLPLMPADWPGTAARNLFLELHRSLEPAAMEAVLLHLRG